MNETKFDFPYPEDPDIIMEKLSMNRSSILTKRKCKESHSFYSSECCSVTRVRDFRLLIGSVSSRLIIKLGVGLCILKPSFPLTDSMLCTCANFSFVVKQF